ncbi:MAG: hypothetical protein PHG04_00715 [Candidatus Nanoarchaeia archaeon]|nr:hypothetical protein [Candidatus Nanoarchaeia archaeon]
MAKLYLMGITNHFEYNKGYFDFVVKTGSDAVFIEETCNSWKNSCQRKMYDDFLEKNIFLIPVYPKKDAGLDDWGVAYLELFYALNIKKNMEKKDCCFAVGAMHLGPEGIESSLEYALKTVECNAEIVLKNFLKNYPENWEKTAGIRKKIISDLIQGIF